MPSTRWRWPESWLEGVALPVLLGTLRIAWIWPWLLFLGSWMTPPAPRPWLPLWSLFVLLLGGRIVAHLAQARCRTLRAARLWVALSGLGVILVVLWWQYGRAASAPGDVGSLQEVVRQLTGWTGTVPAAVWALVVASALWLRGVLDGRAPPGQAQIRGAFLTGCGAFVLLLMAGVVVPAALPPGVQGWLVLFVVAGMAALALSSLEQSSWAGYGAAGARVRMNRYWLGSVALVILAVLALGLAAAAVLEPGAVAGWFAWIGVVLDFVATALVFVLSIFVYAAFLVLSPLLEWLRSRMAEFKPLPLQSMSPLAPPSGSAASQATWLLPAYLEQPLRWLAVVLVLALVAFIFAWALRAARGGADQEVEETRELIFSRELARAQWAAWLARWRRRLARSAAEETFLPLDEEEAGRRRIRFVYQRFLAAMVARRQSRPQGQTPIEYAQVVGDLPPPQRAALDVLTEVYVAARYAPAPPTPGQVEAGEAAWAGLAPALVEADG